MPVAAMQAAGAVVPTTRLRSFHPPQAAAVRNATPLPHPQLKQQFSRSHSRCDLPFSAPMGSAAACVPAPVPASRSEDFGRWSLVRQQRLQRLLTVGAQGSSGGDGDGDGGASGDTGADASVAKRLALLELLSSGSEDEGDERVVTFTTTGSSSNTTSSTTISSSSNIDGLARGDGWQQYDESGDEEGSGWPNAAGRRAGAPLTVREKMMQDYGVLVRGVVVIPLGRRAGFVLKNAAPQTKSQLRNQRRGEYLAKIGQRNDSPFFATVAGLVLVPPFAILAFALASGYLEFLQ